MRSSSCRMTGGGVPGPATLLPPSQVTSHCHWPASGGVLHTGLRRVSGSGRKQPGPWSLPCLHFTVVSTVSILTADRIQTAAGISCAGAGSSLPAALRQCGPAGTTCCVTQLPRAPHVTDTYFLRYYLYLCSVLWRFSCI